MNHPVFVRVLQCIGDVGRDLHRFLDPELGLAIELRAQRLAVDERHDVVQEPARFTRVEQCQDVRML